MSDKKREFPDGLDDHVEATRFALEGAEKRGAKVMTEPPGVIDGVKGILMEFLNFFRVTKRCSSCGSSWNGWYAKEHMDYCHHCGEELIEG